MFALPSVVILLCLLGSPYVQASCGQRPAGQSRIISGQTATPNSWPWQLSLKFNGYHICGASLINEEWAVTAAHCVYQSPYPSSYKVAAGAHKREGDGQLYAVSKVIRHTGFSMQHLRHDVALLKLANKVPLSSKVGTVCLPSQGSNSNSSECWTSGWGRIYQNSNTLPTLLQQTKLPLVDHQTCVRKNGGFVHESSMVCGGASGSSVCQGDSGGPLVCKEGGLWVLRGATSWVTSLQCSVRTYSVYARISSYVNWINDKIKEDNGNGGNGGNGGSDCVDRDANCPHWISHCHLSHIKTHWCRKTCRDC